MSDVDQTPIQFPKSWHREIKLEATKRGLSLKAYLYNCHKLALKRGVKSE